MQTSVSYNIHTVFSSLKCTNHIRGFGISIRTGFIYIFQCEVHSWSIRKSVCLQYVK